MPENQRVLNMAFLGQLYANICWKLQKLEGFAGMNATQLLEVENKLFVNWEQTNKRMKAKVSLWAATLRKLDRPDQVVSTATEGETHWKNPTLMKPMCLLKGIVHWKNECSCHKGPASEPNKITPGKKTG
jgi:hypothetical protein